MATSRPGCTRREAAGEYAYDIQSGRIVLHDRAAALRANETVRQVDLGG